MTRMRSRRNPSAQARSLSLVYHSWNRTMGSEVDSIDANMREPDSVAQSSPQYEHLIQSHFLNQCFSKRTFAKCQRLRAGQIITASPCSLRREFIRLCWCNSMNSPLERFLEVANPKNIPRNVAHAEMREMRSETLGPRVRGALSPGSRYGESRCVRCFSPNERL